MFAKLFEPKPGHQILVKLAANDDDGKPEVRFYCGPEGLGVCASAYIWQDDNDGWDLAEAYFARVDEKEAIKISELISICSRA